MGYHKIIQLLQNFVGKLFKGENFKDKPLGVAANFVIGLFANWYIMIIGPAIIATALFFQILIDKGVIKRIEDLVIEAMTYSVDIIGQCTPKILNFSEFLKCFTGI